MPTENDVDETTESERRPKDVRIADFNEKIEAIVYDEEVLRTHDEWEKVDRAWKSERRFFNEYETEESFESTTELAAEVRIAEKAKDLAHDRASRRGYSLALESGLIEEWDGEKLGHAVKAGSVEELSPEWHELRRGGIGGSALGKILGYHWMSKCGHIIMMDEEEHREGIATLAGEKVAPKEKVTYENSGVIYRGHQWEPVLLAWYANNHNVRVGISKDTWRGHLPYQVINVDGLILGDDGEPVGILECKTASREWVWDSGVPINYRAQVLWYLDATGFDYADVIVKFDTGRMDCFRIYREETIDGTDETPTIPEIYEKVDKLWEDIQLYIKYPGDIIADIPALLEETYTIEDYYLNDEDFDLDLDKINEVLGSNPVYVKSISTLPYKRCEKDFRLLRGLDIDGEIYRMDADNKMRFFHEPISLIASATKNNPDLKGTVVATDTETYHDLIDLYPSLTIVNATALKRSFTLNPAALPFESVSECRNWMNDNIVH